MSNTFDWDSQYDDNEEIEYVETPKPKPKPQAEQAPVQDEVPEEVQDEDLEIDDSVFLNNAKMRLEQARLYELIIQSNLFSGENAEPKIVARVEREIRAFAKERLEILLGMRQPAAAATQSGSQFTDLEADLLKKLLAKFSGGATKSFEATPKASQPSVSLAPIALPKAQPQAIAPVRPVAPTPTTPPSRKPAPVKPAAKPENSEAKPAQPQNTRKKITGSALAERNKLVSERQAARKAALPADRAPIPDVDQQHILYSQQTNRGIRQSTY